MDKHRYRGLRSTDGFVIPLRFIESMSTECSNEDLVVSKLKSDVFITIHTTGGFVHIISVKEMIKKIDKSDIDPTFEQCCTATQDIIDQWWALQD